MNQPSKMTFGIIGLGKMGGNLAKHSLDMGYSVFGFDLGEVDADLQEHGVQVAESLPQLVEELSSPRVIFIYIPAGPAVDSVIDDLAPILDPVDVIIDGGNSYWGDSIRRAERIGSNGPHYLDLGTSGGLEGARCAPCFMLGGPQEAVSIVEPMLIDLAVDGGYVHAGPSGAGHFVKLVHNGIEFGMLQAIGEGMSLLKRVNKNLPLNIQGTLSCWRHGSVIRSWLIDLMAEAYKNDPRLECPSDYVEDTGEVNWLVADAMNLQVPVPVISQSVMALIQSRDEERVAPKAITEMRRGFGGHPWDQNEGIAKERRVGRVGPLHRFSSEEDA